MTDEGLKILEYGEKFTLVGLSKEEFFEANNLYTGGSVGGRPETDANLSASCTMTSHIRTAAGGAADFARWALREVAQLRDDYSGLAEQAEARQQSPLLRDIFGNPFRPVAIDPRWLTSNVVDLSQAIYQERAFEKMPILADALMDAGCDNEEIIQHCRGDGPHVRGCWVVDLLLAKE